MDAPRYPPAAAFERPADAAFEIGVETLSLKELQRSPAAWAIVVKHLPLFKGVVSSPQVAPIAGNMTVESFATYLPGMITRDKVEAINRDLRALPIDQKPAL